MSHAFWSSTHTFHNVLMYVRSFIRFIFVFQWRRSIFISSLHYNGINSFKMNLNSEFEYIQVMLSVEYSWMRKMNGMVGWCSGYAAIFRHTYINKLLNSTYFTFKLDWIITKDCKFHINLNRMTLQRRQLLTYLAIEHLHTHASNIRALNACNRTSFGH